MMNRNDVPVLAARLAVEICDFISPALRARTRERLLSAEGRDLVVECAFVHARLRPSPPGETVAERLDEFSRLYEPLSDDERREVERR